MKQWLSSPRSKQIYKSFIDLFFLFPFPFTPTWIFNAQIFSCVFFFFEKNPNYLNNVDYCGEDLFFFFFFFVVFFLSLSQYLMRICDYAKKKKERKKIELNFFPIHWSWWVAYSPRNLFLSFSFLLIIISFRLCLFLLFGELEGS